MRLGSDTRLRCPADKMRNTSAAAKRNHRVDRLSCSKPWPVCRYLHKYEPQANTKDGRMCCLGVSAGDVCLLEPLFCPILLCAGLNLSDVRTPNLRDSGELWRSRGGGSGQRPRQIRATSRGLRAIAVLLRLCMPCATASMWPHIHNKHSFDTAKILSRHIGLPAKPA